MSRAVVISIDSLFTSDIKFLEELPNFKKILKNASIVKNINCIYPTLTYPCHTTIVSGVYPDKHGICHNEKLELNEKMPEWYWYSKDIKCDTIIDLAKKNNITTSTILWPVTGGCKADHNIAEIWTKDENEDHFKVYDNSCSKHLMKTVYPKYSHIINWNREPFLDEFGVSCAEDIIKEYKPELMLIHLAYLDHTRHKHGLYEKEVINCFPKYDEWIGRIIKALKEAKVYEDTNFIILGDHGQLEVNKLISPNIILKEKGLIDVDENGKIIDYKAICKSAGISTHVIVKDNGCISYLEGILKEMMEYEEFGIEKIFNKNELKKQYKLDCDAEFALEGKPGIAFNNDVCGDISKSVDNSNYKYCLATHGHLPHKGDKPPFIAKGPGIKENVILNKGNLVDEAPTIMKIFNIDMKNIDGTAFDIIK
ncbi:alkaline phosphatase family protein [Paraclostridium sordellii]|uniref:alkaline phosphatase family protein n=1 Tax=Paraclostridium sordellii TaxID=1505 RepID=UPI0005E6D47C|nr:ectonucleotide pyrophosphatase/phosphodiesterase [Paeniclostridium sordellii]CEN79118.1 nucleotide pyrophosphatase [[Clostridium] sordellii] [Paeniclostridium sordellii]